RYAEAEEGYREALALFESILGKSHPHVADTLMNLGNCLRDQGKFDLAREQHQRAREIMQRAFGADHPAVLACLNNLALDAWLEEKPNEALALFDEQRQLARRYLLRDLPFMPAGEQREFQATTETDLFATALSLGRELAKDSEVA